jgi:transmembrane sensor
MTEPRVDWDRIGRYLTGESTPAEAADVRRWLEENPSDTRVIEALDQATKGASAATPVDVEAALRSVKARGRGADAPSRTRRWAMFVAAALITIAVGFGYMRLGVTTLPTTWATLPGVRDSISLGDRAHVILAPGSRLVATEDGGTLVGEAYFTVTHDPARPFTIRAGTVTVHDVGTRFAVRHDSMGTGEVVRVVVLEGSVDVSAAGGVSSARLAAGDEATATGGRVDVRRGVDTAQDVAWTTGRLAFHDAPLAQVLQDLRRWYGLQFEVRDPALLSRHFTGTFDNEPAARVIDVLGLALGARVDRSADTVFLGNLPPSR